MANILNLPDLRPSLLLDFANSRQVDPRVTFGRASTATRWNAVGALETVPTGVPRIDFDPTTGKCLGLLMERASTNLALYSESMRPVSGAWLATRATLEVVTGVAPPLGMSGVSKVTPDGSGSSYISCLTATAPANSPASCTVLVKSAGATTIQLDFIASGFTNIRCTINLLTGAYANGSVGQSRVRSMRDGWFEVSIFGSFAGGDISSWRITVIDANSTAANAFYVTGAQFERSSAPTSYIPTSAAAVTRADEFAGLIGINFSSWHRQDEGTFLFDGAPSSIAPGYGPGLFAVGDATLSFESRNGIYLNASSGTGVLAASLAVAGASQIGTNTVTGAFAAGVSKKTAFAYQTDNTVGATDGVLGVVDTLCTIPKGVTGLSLGELSAGWSGGTSRLNGHIRRFAFYPKRLTAAELKRITEA